MAKNYILDTNISDDNFLIFGLSKKGYGTISELNSHPAETILDLLEYETIVKSLEVNEIQKNEAKYGNSQ